MKSSPHWQIIRVVLALFAIFALGIWTGRVTAPVVKEEPIDFGDAKVAEVSEEKLKRVTRRIIRNYTQDLDLTREQVREMKPLFIKTTRRMIVLPRQSKARLFILEDFHLELDAYLDDEQKKKAAARLERSRAKDRIE